MNGYNGILISNSRGAVQGYHAAWFMHLSFYVDKNDDILNAAFYNPTYNGKNWTWVTYVW